MCCCTRLHQVQWDNCLVLQIYEKAGTVTHCIALKTFNKRGISNGTENSVLFNERESLNNANSTDEWNGDGDFTAFYDQYKLHAALPFWVKYLWMYTSNMDWGGGEHTPLNLTSKIFVCLINRCILWSGNYGLLTYAPRFSWPVSQVYFWISGFRRIMWSYPISVYTAVTIFAKYILL